MPTAQVIHRLRTLDVPLAEVQAVIDTDDPAQRADPKRRDFIAEHLGDSFQRELVAL